MPCWNPYFQSVSGCALFGPSCQKREILDTHQNRKFWLITEKLILGYFLVFLVFFFLLFSFCFLFLFFGGFKGQVTWPKGTPHLALNPPHFFVSFLCFLFLSLLLIGKPVSPQKGHFCLFLSVSLCFSWVIFLLLLLFYFLFLCLSLYLSLVLCFLPPFFSCFLALFCFLGLVSFFLSLLALLCFMSRTASK